MSLNELSIQSACKKLVSGEITSVELTSACLKRIKEVNRKLNACLYVDEKGALKAAKQADIRLANGDRTTLLGIPFLVKDNIMTKGLVTTAGSRMLEKYIAPYDATVIIRLKEAGAVLLGKTNLDEFAHGSSTEYSAFGPSKNPWDLSRVPGGSSGGSAAAVAADMCLFALGTDTGGSVRHPAAFCGITGYKPTYGLCSRFGLIAMTSSTDVPGILAKNSEDAALVLNVIMGKDQHDATTVATTKKQMKMVEKFSWKNVKVGLPEEFKSVKLEPSVRAHFDAMIGIIKKAGGKIVTISLPLSPNAVAAYYVITPSEISSNLARFDGLRFGHSPKKSKNLLDYYVTTREEGFGEEVKRRIILGTFALSAGYADAYYHQAQKVRQGIVQEFNQAFKKCDLIITPSTPTSAFTFGAKKNPLAMYLEDIFSVPASLAGLPAISIPMVKKPLPTGLQIIGPCLSDQTILAAGNNLEHILNLQERPTV
jgi:aspartyl-tRNA(Asn)/glutamyl-tRNA(Gln) amidotransferase subunit A